MELEEEEERKSGSKRRAKQVQVGFDSDDDEPIKSLFKLKTKKRNPKKVKMGWGVVAVKGKAVEVWEDVNEDLGGMEDTLASFRKKLKDPKKESGSGLTVTAGRGWDASGAEPSGRYFVEGGGLVIESYDKDLVIGKDGSDLNVYKDSKIRVEEKVKRFKSSSKPKKTGGYIGEESKPSVDDFLEDPLSSFLQKAQSGSVRKSRLELKSKQRRAAPGNGLTFDDVSESEDLPNSRDALNWAQKIRLCDNSLQLVSGRIPNDSTHSPKKIGMHQTPDKNLQEKALSSNAVQDVSLTPILKDLIMRSSDNRNVGHHEAISDDSVPTSFLQRSQSCLSACSSKTSRLRHRGCVQEGPQLDPRDSDHLHDRYTKEFLYVKMKNDVSLPIQVPTLEIHNPQDGSRTIVLAHKVVEKSNSVSDAGVGNVGFNGCDGLGHVPGRCVEDPELESNQNQPSDDLAKGTSVPNHDYFSGDTEANEASSLFITPGRNESYTEDEVHLPDTEFKDRKQLEVQRAASLLDSHLAEDGDQSSRARETFNFSSNTVTEADNGGIAAVSAGLKARAAGPIEKIRFKELLKRKGGLQEYLQCRNQILGLWRKDVSRILPLTECGVTANPSVDEPRHTSLVRDIYAFLDQNGYINVGVASEKDRAEPSSMHYFKLLKGKNFGEKAGATDGDTDDGVSFIVGRVRSSEVSMGAKKGDILDDHSRAVGVTKDGRLATLQTMDLSTLAEPDVCRAGQLHDNGSGDAKYPRRMVDVKVLSSNPSEEVLDGGAVLAMTPEPTKHLYGVRSASNDGGEETHTMQCGSEVRKRVIVIGAGPAGLTAARHLQRQGFSVAVLEARSRIGGRVYTDRSSLSVPVDLGASIITGVEADVATERRPDPSSLVCAQLGLELTVLNSDCPLYDIVTGEKVPADLDEALEVEYNCLIDDLVLLVAQKGERAMKMSLEDGLEYALKRRRMARLGRKCVESELHNSADALVDSEASVDGKVSENNSSKEEILSALERRVMDWHYAHLEYGCAALLKEVSLPYWNQDDVYGGFGGAHCMIKGGYGTVVESLGKGLCIHLNHVVTDISYSTKDCTGNGSPGNEVKVSTSNGSVFWCEAVLVTVPLGCLKAEAIKFSPPLPPWKNLSIHRLGFGVLNKVVLEFSEVFWDDSVDYFGATAEKTNNRGQCFMFWNIKKTVGAPVLVALVVGKAAIDGQKMSSSNHVNNALTVLRELFGEVAVPDPVASVVTDWGKDPFSYGAYSYVAVGASGEDYDILGRPVENCLFFAGEATCKEHPDTVGGAMISGLREAVRIIDILNAGHDYTAEGEAMDAAERHSESEMNEVCDIVRRLEAVDISNVMYRNTLDGPKSLVRETLLEEMFSYAKTTAGRLHLAKELLNLPVEALKSFTGTKEGLSTLNSWILDSMGKDGTQLLRHCVRILVLVSTDLLAVRLSGIGKTVREKVCVHTSRDIRAIASQLVNMWIEVFRKEKASNGGLKLLRQLTAADSSKSKSLSSGKPPLRMHHGPPDNKESSQISSFAGSHLPRSATVQRENVKPVKLEIKTDSKLEGKLSRSRGCIRRENARGEEGHNFVMSEEEQAAFAAAEAARAAALAAAEAYASSEAKCNTSLPLPKILSFHKFAIRDQYTQRDESDFRRKWSDGERQECTSEIDSRNFRVRDWSVDFSAAGVNIDSSKRSIDNLSQRSHSTEIACQSNFRGHSPERGAVDSSIFTKAWVDADGSMGIKDSNAIDRWQSQAAAAESDFFHRAMQIRDEEDSNMNSKLRTCRFGQLANETSVSQVTVNKELVANQPKGADHIKQAVVDYVASLLMPLYKAKKIEKEGYKSIMKKTATKVMELTTDGEKAMAVYEFLDFKRKNKIRSFVDTMIERHMATKQVAKP